jgi:hypothetical protein
MMKLLAFPEINQLMLILLLHAMSVPLSPQYPLAKVVSAAVGVGQSPV